MLSLENQQLCQRDQAIQGLDIVLQPDEILSALQQHGLTDAQSVRLDYLRYKPLRRCIGLFEVTWNTTATHMPTALVATAMTADSWKKFTETRADSAIENGAILLPSKRLALEWFPHDHALKNVAKVVSSSTRDKVLRRILQTEHLDHIDLKTLAYKPARRHVASGMSHGKPVFTLKTYTNSGYTDADWRIRLATESGLSNCRVLGSSPRYNSIATSWVEGQTLSQWVLTADCSLPVIAEVGQELAKWHSRSQQLLSQIPSNANQVCQITSLNELAEDIGVLAPKHAGRARALARQIQTRLSQLPPPQDLIHGDFYAKQVILTQCTASLRQQCTASLRRRDESAASLRRQDENITRDSHQIHFIDFDEIRLGDRYEDIANFVAKNHWQTVLESLDTHQCQAINQTFLEGYAAHFGKLDLNRLHLHVSLAMFRCVPHAFRRALPNWTHQIGFLLNVVEHWLEQCATGSNVTESTSTSSLELNNYLDIHQVQQSMLNDDAVVDDSLKACTVVSAKLLRHKPQRRLLVEYALLDSERPDRIIRVLGKARLSKSLDTRTPRLHQQLQQCDWNQSEVAFPKALGVLPSMRVWLQERIDGIGVYPSSSSLNQTTNLATHARIGRALADFHQADIRLDRCFGVTNELEKLAELFSQLGDSRPELKDDLVIVESYCRRLAMELPSTKLVLIHRDFYFDQVLVTKEKGHSSLVAATWEPTALQALPAGATIEPRMREAEPPRQCVPRHEPGNEHIGGGVQREVSEKVYLLDLDLACMGPAELDVGNYLAHLDEYGVRFPEEQENCQVAAGHFLTGYLEHRSSTHTEAISIWRELSLARHIALSNRIPGRQNTTVRLLERFVGLAEEGLALPRPHKLLPRQDA